MESQDLNTRKQGKLEIRGKKYSGSGGHCPESDRSFYVSLQ